jgi:hypothetical protein
MGMYVSRFVLFLRFTSPRSASDYVIEWLIDRYNVVDFVTRCLANAKVLYWKEANEEEEEEEKAKE